MTQERLQEMRDVLFGVAAQLRQKLYPTPAPLEHRTPIAAE